MDYMEYVNEADRAKLHRRRAVESRQLAKEDRANGNKDLAVIEEETASHHDAQAERIEALERGRQAP